MIPNALLPHEITIEPYTGESATAPLYGAAVTTRARVDPRRQVIGKPDGSQIVSSAVATLRPNVTVTPQSRVTWDGIHYRVLDVVRIGDLRRDFALQLALGRSES